MKTMKKHEMEKKIAELERERSALQLALYATLARTTDAREEFTVDGWTHTYTLHKAAHPSGGVVICRSSHSAGRGSSSVEYLDDLATRTEEAVRLGDSPKHLTAVRRLMVAREAIVAPAPAQAPAA